MNLEQYNSIAFDCDGVILNSNKIKTNSFFSVTKKFGVNNAQNLVDFHKSNGGISRYKKFEYFKNSLMKSSRFEIQIADLIKDYSDEVYKKLLKCEIADNLRSLLSNLNDKRLFVVSGSDQEELKKVFTKRNLIDLFNGGIFGSPDDKETIFKREIKSGNMKEPILYLGDSKYDYNAAQKNSVDFIFCYKWTEFLDWEGYCINNKIKFISQVKDIIL